MINVLWPLGARGLWDQGMILQALRGDLWPIPLEFDERMGITAPPGEGAIMVVAGGWMMGDGCGGAPYIIGDLTVEGGVSRLPWCLLIHASDEEQLFSSAEFRRPNVRVWLQSPNPARPAPADRVILYGCPEDTRRLLGGLPRRPAAERQLWRFAGQVTHEKRHECVADLSIRPHGEGQLLGTQGFAQGLERSDYLSFLAGAAIAPAPSGPVTPESFRLYEALEAGCLPIADRRAPGWPAMVNYWDRMFDGPPPFPTVDRWHNVHAILDRYEADPLALQRDTNRAQAWWLGYKRQFTLDLVDDVVALSGAEGPQDRGTVLMPTSPVASHPSTELIEDSIRRVRAYPELKDAEIIIMIDGVREEDAHREADYEEYKRRLIDLCGWHPDFRGCLPVVFDRHTHQANMTRRALELVRTPLVFFVEHDTWPTGDIDFGGIFRSFSREEVNYVRLSIFHTLLAEHHYLYLDLTPQLVEGTPMVRTLQWSQRPHVARTDWYRKIVADYFKPTARTMIEDVMHGVVIDSVARGVERWERWGMWQYMPAGGDNIVRSGTSNGRGSDPMHPMYPE